MERKKRAKLVNKRKASELSIETAPASEPASATSASIPIDIASAIPESNNNNNSV